MSDFKIGDVVIRIGRAFNNMEIGDTDEVVGISNGSDGYTPGTMVLKNFGGGHNVSNFKLLEQPIPAWNYAEADRLQKAATEATKAYNDYISKKPEKEYTPL